MNVSINEWVAISALVAVILVKGFQYKRVFKLHAKDGPREITLDTRDDDDPKLPNPKKS